MLDVLPLLKGAERARAERLALDLAAAMSLRDVAEQISEHDRAKRLQEADTPFLVALADAALARLPQEKDVWARASALPILLRLLDRDRAATVAAAEADRVLLVDDLWDRAVTLATFAERLEEKRGDGALRYGAITIFAGYPWQSQRRSGPGAQTAVL